MIPCSRFRDGPLLPVHESEGRDAVGVEHSLAAEGAGLQPYGDPGGRPGARPFHAHHGARGPRGPRDPSGRPSRAPDPAPANSTRTTAFVRSSAASTRPPTVFSAASKIPGGTAPQLTESAPVAIAL